MARCFTNRASVARVLPMHLCITSWLLKIIFPVIFLCNLLNTDTAGFNCKQLRAVSIQRWCLINIGCPITKIRLSHDHLIFIMEIHIPDIETEPNTPIYQLQHSCNNDEICTWKHDQFPLFIIFLMTMGPNYFLNCLSIWIRNSGHT